MDGIDDNPEAAVDNPDKGVADQFADTKGRAKIGIDSGTNLEFAEPSFAKDPSPGTTAISRFNPGWIPLGFPKDVGDE